MIKKVNIFLVFLLIIFSLNTKAFASEKNVFDKTLLDNGIITINYNIKDNVNTKVMIQKDDKKYFYEYYSRSSFPLQLGNGKYTIAILENKSGSKYIVADKENIELNLKDDKVIYLNSIQNISWNYDMEAIKKAKELTKDLQTDEQRIEAICNYIIKNFEYDDSKITNKGNSVPDINEIFIKSKGVCYDYSILTASMLRSLNIPTKLVKGYKNDISTYHAWNEVYLNGKWNIIDTTYDATMFKNDLSYSIFKSDSDYSAEMEY